MGTVSDFFPKCGKTCKPSFIIFYKICEYLLNLLESSS